MLEEGLEGILHFDSKVFKTLGLLLFKPGALTKRFLEGHRVPYVPPIRLYVFISFLFFLVLSLQGGSHGSRKPFSQEVAEDIEKAKASGKAGHVEVLPGIIIDTKPDTSLLEMVARPLRQRARQGDKEAARQLAALDTAKQVLASKKKRRKRYPDSGPKLFVLGFDMSKINFAKLPPNMSAAQVDSVIRSARGEPTSLSRLAVRRAARWHDITREELVHQVLRAASIMMFLLMPLAALLLKGFYFRQGRYYISHLVFTVHLHCFAFIVLLLGSVFARVPRLGDLLSLLPLLSGIYFVAALRTFYGQSLSRTLGKSVLLGLSYLLVLSFSMAAVATMGALVF